MNNTARFLSIAAVAAFASFGAHADEADASQFATKFETNRTRAEVAAEAATVAQTRSIEPAGSRVVTYKSTADRAAVRAQAAEALRTGQISSGEIGNAMSLPQTPCARHGGFVNELCKCKRPGPCEGPRPFLWRHCRSGSTLKESA